MTISCLALLLVPLCTGPQVVVARLGMSAQSLTDDTFQAFVQKNDKVLVDFYDPRDPRWREGKNELEAAVRNVRNVGSKVPFVKVDASKETVLAARFVPDGKYPQLLWFLHGEPTQYHRTLRTSKAIGDFVMALDRDAMVALKSEEEAHDFVPAVFARVAKNSPMYKTLEVVAAKHMDTVAFTFLEGPSHEFSWMARDAAPMKYKGEVTAKAIDKWVRMNLLMSEPIPEGPVLLEDEGSTIVVGRTFEDTMLQKDRDVIMQVYAPWCGFCKKLAPIWNAFAQEVNGVPNLVVAKMDGSRNGSPLPEDFSWNAYPKIFLVRAGETKPIHFEGERSVKNLIEFVRKHGSKSLDIGKTDSREGSIESITDL